MIAFSLSEHYKTGGLSGLEHRHSMMDSVKPRSSRQKCSTWCLNNSLQSAEVMATPLNQGIPEYYLKSIRGCRQILALGLQLLHTDPVSLMS